MTIQGAGILFVTPDKCALFLKRGPGGDYPGLWCFPGGTKENEETAEETAVREANEELGKFPEGTRFCWTRTVSAEGVDFTTYKQEVGKTFTPRINGEHTGYAWAPIDSPPEPLHPGCRPALERFHWNELGVAEAIRDGKLTSPQKYENMWLFAIRITGTGVAYRHSWKEFVWRDPSLYMNEDFLRRCNGLTVIMEHPEGATLDSQEFANRVVGSVLLPYLKQEEQEVWAIAKIYDEKCAELLTSKQLSTSPSVVFRDPDVNTKMTLEDGQNLLIEGEPQLLDHIAICEQGVWDKGGAPAGVQVDDLRSDSEYVSVFRPLHARIDAAMAKADSVALDVKYPNITRISR